jgi:hypothetical protein
LSLNGAREKSCCFQNRKTLKIRKRRKENPGNNVLAGQFPAYVVVSVLPLPILSISAKQETIKITVAVAETTTFFIAAALSPASFISIRYGELPEKYRFII